MGVNVSQDCGCLAAVSKAAGSLWKKKYEESHLSVLEDDEIAPAGLLSEHEIQSLLMESNYNETQKSEKITTRKN